MRCMDPGLKAHRSSSEEKPGSELRARLHEVIFESDTPAGKTFDVALLGSIVLSVLAVMLESIADVKARFGQELQVAEWVFTILFTVEYVLRLLAVRKPWLYASSFYGLIDLVSVAPAYLSLAMPGAQALLVVRVLRLVRVFRVFKLTRFLGEGHSLWNALRASRPKIVVFLTTVMALVCVMGTLVYIVEGPENGYTSIPRSIYWAIVTMTTVGYGDMSPSTPLGQAIASVAMILGYGILAVPTGIVSSELAKRAGTATSSQACPSCSAEGHDEDAVFCKYCGCKL